MKRSMLLIAILVVLLGIYWLVQSKRPVVSADRPFIEADSAKIDFLRVEFAGDTVEMRKEGETWTLVVPLKFPASQRSVQQVVGKLGGIKKLALITKNADKHAEYQIDAAMGVRVKVGQGGKYSEFVVGKGGSTGQTSFARLANSDEVWEVSGNNSSLFKKKAKDWRDKTITEFDQAELRKIILRHPDQTIALTLVDSTWKVDTGKEQFDGVKDLVGRLTGLLSRMSAVDFADTLGVDAFAKPVFQLEAELSSGEKLDLKLNPKDAEGSQYFVRKAGSAADYVIYKSTANVLMKRPSDFRESAEPAAKKPPSPKVS